MEQHYPVMYQQKKAGYISFYPEGLYYRIHCRTRLSGLRVYVKTAKRNVDLGICVPMADGYGFDIKKSKKSIPEEIEEIFLSKTGNMTALYPIAPAEPFAHLNMVSSGALCLEKGRHYLKTY